MRALAREEPFDNGEQSMMLHANKKQWLELQRLLYCMERTQQTTDTLSSSSDNDDKQPTWQSFLHRAHHCQHLWQQLLQSEGSESSSSMSSLDPSLQLKVSHRIDQACRRAYEMAEMQRQRQEPQGDLIDRIFFAEEKKEENEGEDYDNDQERNKQDMDENDLYDGLLDDKDNDDDYRDHDTSVSRQEQQQADPKATLMSPEELQKKQREQMEEAIGLMASQMKQATQGIQQQLQQQTGQTLTELEMAAEQNVHDVAQVAQNVQRHNQRQRTRNWGTWTLIFTIVGVFLFCLVTIFTIPKRPNTCLILCQGETSFVGWFLQPLRAASKLVPAQKLLDLFSGDKMEQDDNNDKDESSKWDSYYDEDEMERKEKERLDQILHSLQHDNDDRSQQQGTAQKTVDWRGAINDDSPDTQQHGIKHEMDDEDPFGGRKPVPKQPVNEDKKLSDPLKGRKPIDRKLPDRIADDDPFGGRKPVQKAKNDDFEAFAGRQPVKKEGQQNERDPLAETKESNEIPPNHRAEAADVLPDSSVQGTNDEKVAGPKLPETVEDVDMADLLASLSQAAKKTEQERLDEIEAFHTKGPLGASSTTQSSTDGVTDPALVREGQAKLRVSPRDIRFTAEMGDVAKLQEMLELQPGFVDRQDRNKWTALHLAARSGQSEAVQVLLDNGASLTLRNNRGKTPLEEATAHLGNDHETVRLLRRLSEQGSEVSHGSSTVSIMANDPVRIAKIQAKQETLRSALEKGDAVDDLDAYRQAGRTKLEKLDEANDRRVTVKPIPKDDEGSERDQYQYIQEVRNRLDGILRSDMVRDEL